MNSCVASFCTYSPRASCASAISVSWPTGDAPRSCRFAFNCSVHHRKRRPIKTPLVRTISGAAPSAVDRWWWWKGSPRQKSNFALHPGSRLLHETTLSNPNPSRVSARCVPLCLAATQISSSSFLRAVSAIFFRGSQLPLPSAVLYCTASATPRTAAFPHSISIGPPSAATTGGFLLTA